MGNVHRALVAIYALAALAADGRAFRHGKEGTLLAAIVQYGRPLIALLTVMISVYFATTVASSLRTVTAAGPSGLAYVVESRGRPNRRRRYRTTYPLDHLCLVESARYKPIVPIAAAVAWLVVAAGFASVFPLAAILPLVVGAIHVWMLLRVVTSVVTSSPRADVYVGRAGSGDVFLAGASHGTHVALAVDTWFTQRRLVLRGERLTRVERVRRLRLAWFFVALLVALMVYVVERSAPLAVAAAAPVVAVAVALMFRFASVAQFTSGTTWPVPGDHLEPLSLLLTRASLAREGQAAEAAMAAGALLPARGEAEAAAEAAAAAAPASARPVAALEKETAAPSLRPRGWRVGVALGVLGVVALGAAAAVPLLKDRGKAGLAGASGAGFAEAESTVMRLNAEREIAETVRRQTLAPTPAPRPDPAPAPQAVPAMAPPPAGRCSPAALACPDGSPTMDVAHVAQARAEREAGRPRDALCSLGEMVNDERAVLALVARETALAWDAQGCRAEAQQAICADLAAPRPDETGWRDTCAACRQLEAACCAPCGEALPLVAQGPAQLLVMQRQALAEHDLDAYAATLDPGLLRVGASAGDIDGARDAGLADLARDLERMRKKGALSRVVSRWSLVSPVSEDDRVAWLVDDFEWTWVTDGKEKKLAFVVSQVAVRQDDGWRVVAAHWSRPLADKVALARARDGKQPAAETWPAPTGGDGAAAAEDARVAFRDALGAAPLAPLLGAREDAVALGSAEGEHWTGRAMAKAWTGIEARVAVEGEPSAWPIAGGAAVWVAVNLLLFAPGETPVVAEADPAGAPVDAGPPGPTPRRYRLTALLVRADVGWQIVALHASSAR